MSSHVTCHSISSALTRPHHERASCRQHMPYDLAAESRKRSPRLTTRTVSETGTDCILVVHDIISRQGVTRSYRASNRDRDISSTVQLLIRQSGSPLKAFGMISSI
jgi:hypothetical protein